MILTHEDRSQIEQMFRIMCFNVYMQNLDDHTKNFAFIYDDLIAVGKTAGMSYNRCKQIIEEIKQTIGTKEAGSE